jgi:small-conductance mechanosensitive channel
MTAGELAIALISALGVGAVIQAFINAWLNRRKGKAETAKVEADTAETIGRVWKHLLDELQEKLQKQEERINALEKGDAMKDDQIRNMQAALIVKDQQIACLEAEIAELRKYIEKMGHKPPPRKRTWHSRCSRHSTPFAR